MVTSRATATRVVCIGNPIAADDGVGIRIGEHLAAMALPDWITVESRPLVGIDLLDVLHAEEDLVLVDACHTGAAPGTVRVLDLSDLTAMSSDQACLHSVGICDVLAIAKRASPETLPRSVHVVAVEGRVFHWLAPGLSPEVEGAMAEAIDTLLALLGLPRPLPTS